MLPTEFQDTVGCSGGPLDTACLAGVGVDSLFHSQLHGVPSGLQKRGTLSRPPKLDDVQESTCFDASCRINPRLYARISA